MNRRCGLWLATAIYFLLLVAFLLVFGYTPTNDTDAYIELAEVCLAHNDIYPSVYLFKGVPFIWHLGPINMLILSLKWFSSLMPLLVFYCLLKAFTAFFIVKISDLFFPTRIGNIVFLMYVLYLNNWGMSTTMLSEVPMICFLMMGLYFVLSSQQLISVVLAGVALAVANWFRPIAGIFLIALLIWFLLFQRRNLLRKWMPLVATYAIVLCLIGFNSYLRTGHFIYQGNSFWYNMADDCYDGATPDPHFGEELYKKGTPRYIENREQLTCFECEEIWRERCTEWLSTHKMEYLKKMPYRLFYMYQNDIDFITAFLPEKSIAEKNYVTLPLRSLSTAYASLTATQWVALMATGCYVLLLFLSLMGSLQLVRRREWQFLTLAYLIIIGGTLGTILLVQGETRFKAPYMAWFFLLAAAAFIKKNEHLSK